MMIIDRFEGDYAICEENGQMISIPSNMLPNGCREGSIIQLTNHGYELLDEASRREQMRQKMKSLFKK